MKNTLRLLLLGLMTWAIPFFLAFFFMDKNGQLSIELFLFKTIMIITGGISGAFAIIIFFRKRDNAYLKQGIIAGIIWFALNVIIDLLVLVPMSQMPYNEYFTQIGLRYLMIPIMCITTGYLLEIKTFKS